MKLQSMSLRRIMACVLSLLMIITALPLGVSANGGGGSGGDGGNKPLTVTAEKGIVVGDELKQEVTKDDADADGYYTVRINVTGDVDTTTVKPNADVILIVDDSGSMDDPAYTEKCNATKDSIKLQSWYGKTYYECEECGEIYSKSEYENFKKCRGEKTVKRYEVAQDVSEIFADNILEEGNDNRLSFISFASYVRQNVDLTSDLSKITTAIQELDGSNGNGGTNYYYPLEQAYNYLKKRHDNSRPAYVIFISDGEPNDWPEDFLDITSDIKKLGATIYTIGIGIEETDNEWSDDYWANYYLKMIATDPDEAKFMKEVDNEQLNEILNEWAKKINTIYAGKEATLTDVINLDEFDYESRSLRAYDINNDPLPDDEQPIIDNDGNITWYIEKIPAEGVYLEFKVKLNEGNANAAGSHYTNKSVELEYTDSEGDKQYLDEDDIGDPCVIVPAPKTHTITIVVENGTSDPASPVIVTEGGSQTITFTADEGYAIDTVTVDDTPAALDADDSYTFSNVTKDQTIKVVYSEDNNKDGTPDKYQATVTYKVVNGTWSNDTTDDIIVDFDLKKKDNNGIWVDLNPTLGESIPEGMKPSEDYTDNGTWDADIDSSTLVTANVTYTYTFNEIAKDTVTSIEFHIQTADATKPYDKTPLTKNELVEEGTYVVLTLDDDKEVTVPYSELEITKPTPEDGNWIVKYTDGDTYFEWEIDITGTITNVGTELNTIADPVLTNDFGANSEYDYAEGITPTVVPNCGILEITNATVDSYEVTITSGSDFKTYNEEPLTCYDEPTVVVTTHLSDGTEGTILPENLNIVPDVTHENIWHITYVVNDVTLFAIDVEITGSCEGRIDEPTTADNTLKAETVGATDVEVKINCVPGTLTVNPKSAVEITFVADVGGKLVLGEYEYNSGEEYTHTVQPADLTVDIADEYLPTAVAEEGYIFDGWYLNNNELPYGVKITPAYDDVAGENEWTERTYTAKFTRDPAYIVTDIKLYIESDSATKADDGEPLTWHKLVEDSISVELINENGDTIETITNEYLTITPNAENDAIWYIEYNDNNVTVFNTEVKITGKRVGIGSEDNTFIAMPRVSESFDGTEHFYDKGLKVEVIPTYGTLTITNAKVLSYEVTITSGSDYKTFNGEPLTCYDEPTVEVTTILSDNTIGQIDKYNLNVAKNPENPSEWRITYVVNGLTLFEIDVDITGVNEGQVDKETTTENTLEEKRVDNNTGVEVNITYEPGTLTVLPKPAVEIRFEAEKGGKLYLGGIVYNDGSEYTYTVRSDALKSPIDDIMLPTAVADEGYIFHGWFIDDKKINDKKGLAQPEFDDVADKDEWTNRTYVAKFYPDPNYETDEEKDARTINKLTLDIISGSAQKEYDGKPLYERTKLDAVLRADLKDGTTTELQITVTKDSEDATNGGWTIKYDDNTYSILSFEIDIFGEQTNIGKAENEFYVTVINENEDIYKDNYDYIYPYDLLDKITINQVYGKLEVTSPIPVEAKPVEYELTLISGSAEKEYDGSALTCDKLSATAKLTMDGGATENVAPVVKQVSAFNYTVKIEHNNTYAIFDVEITGSQTIVGSSKNDIEVKVVDHNFVNGGTIGYTRGTLTVTEEDDDGGFIILPAGFLYIENNVIAPDGFAKDEFTYEVYDNNTGKLIETVTIDANDRSRGVMFAYNTEVYVVPVDMEVEGYNLVTTSDPSDATDDVYVSQDTTIEFTHVYTVQLNTEDHYAYIIGYEDGTVRPQGLITRAEVATIFYRLLSDEARAAFFTQDNNYVDVASDAWYNNAISTMTNAGLFNGYPDGTFNPDGPITRAELVKVAASFFGNFEPGTSIFSDTDGHWASDFIDEAYVLGIVNGYTDGTFKPDQYITRAEAMKIVNGILGRDSVTGDLIDDMVIWSDNLDPDAWYYYIVQEATNSHEYVIDNDEETWTAALPNRDWSELEKVDTEI